MENWAKLAEPRVERVTTEQQLGSFGIDRVCQLRHGPRLDRRQRLEGRRARPYYMLSASTCPGLRRHRAISAVDTGTIAGLKAAFLRCCNPDINVPAMFAADGDADMAVDRSRSAFAIRSRSANSASRRLYPLRPIRRPEPRPQPFKLFARTRSPQHETRSAIGT